MKGKNKTQPAFTQGIDHEDGLDKQIPFAKNKKQGHRAHTDKFSENWESDNASETYNKGKAYAHGGRRNR